MNTTEKEKKSSIRSHSVCRGNLELAKSRSVGRTDGRSVGRLDRAGIKADAEVCLSI